jgi:hypothetical protein
MRNRIYHFLVHLRVLDVAGNYQRIRPLVRADIAVTEVETEEVRVDRTILVAPCCALKNRLCRNDWNRDASSSPLRNGGSSYAGPLGDFMVAQTSSEQVSNRVSPFFRKVSGHEHMFLYGSDIFVPAPGV